MSGINLKPASKFTRRSDHDHACLLTWIILKNSCMDIHRDASCLGLPQAATAAAAAATAAGGNVFKSPT
jgi:hypothetical protein